MSVAAPRSVDDEAILDSVRARIRRRDAELADLADRSIARLTPERWAIEWHLPEWLGARFGIEGGVVRELVESNVLGLLSIRLADDLTDSDVATEDIEQARLLAALAYHEALDVYRRTFPDESPFWSMLRGSMDAWERGADGRDLATRGAPLKIGAYACCLLGERLAVWPALERCLARSVTALVLYDQFVDWEADVEAGRWNAFVAGVLPGQSATRPPRAVRASVLAALLTGDGVAEHFGRIALEAQAAARLAEDFALGELSAYLRSWAAATAAQGVEVADRYRAIGGQATRLLFQNGFDTANGGGPA